VTSRFQFAVALAVALDEELFTHNTRSKKKRQKTPFKFGSLKAIEIAVRVLFTVIWMYRYMDGPGASELAGPCS
jgi:hypothetical protein